MDGAIHCHARAFLAGRFSAHRSGHPQGAGRKQSQTNFRTGRKMAAMAGLRRSAPLVGVGEKMMTVILSKQKKMNYHYKTMDSVVGKLKLVATDKGLAAILWENDNPRRVRLGSVSENKKHPVLRETEKQLGEYFAGKRKCFSVKLDAKGTVFQIPGVGSIADYSVWRNAKLRADRRANWKCPGHARGRSRQWEKSDFNYRALPPGHRRFGSPYRFRGRTGR